MSAPVLAIRDLHVALAGGAGDTPLLEGIDLDVAAGQTVCVVGESGSGKSILASSVMGLLPAQARVRAGSIRLAGTELVGIGHRRLQALRGPGMAMVFQHPGACLNPLMDIGTHLAEVLHVHGIHRHAQVRKASLDLLGQVGMNEPERRLRQYPHQLSGGLQQRVLIAMAVAARPRLLIADEPTTALDASVQAQILALLGDLQQRTGMAMLFISHDIGVVAQIADAVAVLYAGQVVERGSAAQVLGDPQHPYTLALRASTPQLHEPGRRLPTIEGQVPAVGDWPAGCRFHPRCLFADASCTTGPVPERALEQGHWARCLKAPLEIAA